MLNHMNGKINNWKDLLEEYQDVLNYSFDLSNVQFADLLYNNPNYLTLKDPMQIEYKGIKLCIISKDQVDIVNELTQSIKKIRNEIQQMQQQIRNMELEEIQEQTRIYISKDEIDTIQRKFRNKTIIQDIQQQIKNFKQYSSNLGAFYQQELQNLGSYCFDQIKFLQLEYTSQVLQMEQDWKQKFDKIQEKQQEQNEESIKEQEINKKEKKVNSFEEQVEIDLLKDQIRILSDFRTAYEKTLENFQETNKRKIEQVNKELQGTQEMQEQYDEQLKKMEHRLNGKDEELKEQSAKLKDARIEIDQLRKELEQKNRILESFIELNEGNKQQQGRQKGEQSGIIRQLNKRSLKQLKWQVKSYKNLNLTLEDLLRQKKLDDSVQIDYLKSKMRFQQDLIKQILDQKDNLQIRMEDLRQKKRKYNVYRQEQQKQTNQQENNDNKIELLIEINRLKQENKDLKYKLETNRLLIQDQDQLEQMANDQNSQLSQNDYEKIFKMWPLIEKTILLGKYHEI